jgi:hypothetical protein
MCGRKETSFIYVIYLLVQFLYFEAHIFYDFYSDFIEIL